MYISQILLGLAGRQISGVFIINIYSKLEIKLHSNFEQLYVLPFDQLFYMYVTIHYIRS